MPDPVILWFRHDLRLSDHPALQAALATGAPIVPIYILDDETPDRWAMGGASRWWLEQSLKSLAESLQTRGSRLILRRGPAVRALAELTQETGANALFWSRGYEPWARKLEQDLHAQLDIACHRYSGALLFEPEAVETKQGGPFRVYTPFSKACFVKGVAGDAIPAPKKLPAVPQALKSESLADWLLSPQNPDWAGGIRETWQPGEQSARETLTTFIENALQGYGEGRDRPDRIGTSRLSPYLHFGEISPRTCWQAIQSAEARNSVNERDTLSFLRELLWREFSYHLLFHWPELPEEPFRPEFADFPWDSNKSALQAWQHGQTGYPIVDAGMRELWHTGWMHNRVRMITASFLIKHLRLHWMEGEAWFWDTLVDADLASNAASWQWVAGCGADAAPYFRIFNPMLQGTKFDPDGDYVRRWVPELAKLPAKHIHMPWEAPSKVLKKAAVELGQNYPEPIVDHKTAREAALAAFKAIKKDR